MTLALALALAAVGPARADLPPAEPDAGASSDAGARPVEADTGPEAETEHRLRWNEAEWRRFDWIEYSLTAVVLGVYAGIEFGVDPPSEANWTGPILFDGGFRDLVVGGSRRVRSDTGAVSDAFTLINQGWAFFDTIAIPLFTDDWNFDVAWQMSAMNIQALGLVGLLSRFGHRVIGRERPDHPECLEDRDYGPSCFSGSNASFPSGHTSAAFVASGLICAHHQHLPLYGGGTADMAACIVSLTMATGSASMRMIADRHWFSDVFVGALLGFGIGYGFPLLLHYTGADTHPKRVPLIDEAAAPSVRWSIAPLSADDALGAQVFGLW